MKRKTTTAPLVDRVKQSDARISDALDILNEHERGKRALNDFKSMCLNGAVGLDSFGMGAIATLAKEIADGRRDFLHKIQPSKTSKQINLDEAFSNKKWAVNVRNVAQLIEELKRLPPDLAIEQGFDEGCDAVVFNRDRSDVKPHLGFRESFEWAE